MEEGPGRDIIDANRMLTELLLATKNMSPDHADRILTAMHNALCSIAADDDSDKTLRSLFLGFTDELEKPLGNIPPSLQKAFGNQLMSMTRRLNEKGLDAQLSEADIATYASQYGDLVLSATGTLSSSQTIYFY